MLQHSNFVGPGKQNLVAGKGVSSSLQNRNGVLGGAMRRRGGISSFFSVLIPPTTLDEKGHYILEEKKVEGEIDNKKEEFADISKKG